MVLFIWARSILCLVRLFASAGAEGDGGTVTAFLWLFPHGASFIRSTREMSLSRISLPFAITTSLSMTLRNSLILPGK